jgi:hypothetical protein
MLGWQTRAASLSLENVARAESRHERLSNPLDFGHSLGTGRANQFKDMHLRRRAGHRLRCAGENSAIIGKWLASYLVAALGFSGVRFTIEAGIDVDHSLEEIRSAALDLLAGRERTARELSNYENLLFAISDVFGRREGKQVHAYPSYGGDNLSNSDRDLFLEVFWTLFREGVITLGLNDANRQFPFFRVTELGRRILAGQQAHFFHDLSSYERLIRAEIRNIDNITLLYLKEAMQSFRTGCILASTVMLGVATEHTFFLLLERIEQNVAYSARFANVANERTVLQKVNKFKNILDQELRNLPPEVKEDLDTHFAGILSIIRTFRNQSGHPTGKIVDREQAYVLLNLFIPYCKKMYQLMDHYT